jgi:uncharacterized protein YyaL (SSP411 family)
MDFYVGPIRELAIVGDDPTPFVRVVHEALRPRLVIAAGPGDGTASAIALLNGREQAAGRSAAYLCEHFSCRMPTDDPAELAAQLLD